jgi:sulfopyruvate decarboxylase TPP-binding subunit
MLWPLASIMLISERITEQENIAAEDCMGKQIIKILQQRIAWEDKENDCNRGLQGNTKKKILQQRIAKA